DGLVDDVGVAGRHLRERGIGRRSQGREGALTGRDKITAVDEVSRGLRNEGRRAQAQTSDLKVAIAFISTKFLPGNALTATVVRVGGATPLKKEFQTSFMRPNSAM